MSTGVRNLTATSFAILGLLNLRPWSGYELAQQMSRSLGYIWPRAISAIYEEPRNLVGHGLARATDEATGRRPKTVYSITDRGRDALRDWLALESALPQFESEAMVRISFPEAASKSVLLDNIRQLGRQGLGIRGQVVNQVREYLQPTHGPFPERLHVIALDARFVSDYAGFLIGWAEWAEGQVGLWPARRAVPVRESLKILRGVGEGQDGAIRVREMARGEEALVAGLTLHAHAEFSSRLPDAGWPEYQADLLDVAARAAKGTVLVAELSGHVAGAVCYAPVAPSIPGIPAGFALLSALSVAPAARGRRVGAALTAACIDRAAQAGLPGIGLQAAEEMRAARSLFGRLGFRDAGLALHPVGVEFHLMVKELKARPGA